MGWTSKQRKNRIKVTTPEGEVKVVKPGHFRKPSKRRRRLTQYEHYLRSKHWRQVRASVLERDGYRCVTCGRQGRLQVHHLSYERFGQERLSDLTTLCRLCHESVHAGTVRPPRRADAK